MTEHSVIAYWMIYIFLFHFHFIPTLYINMTLIVPSYNVYVMKNLIYTIMSCTHDFVTFPSKTCTPCIVEF